MWNAEQLEQNLGETSIPPPPSASLSLTHTRAAPTSTAIAAAPGRGFGRHPRPSQIRSTIAHGGRGLGFCLRPDCNLSIHVQVALSGIHHKPRLRLHHRLLGATVGSASAVTPPHRRLVVLLLDLLVSLNFCAVIVEYDHGYTRRYLYGLEGSRVQFLANLFHM
ncbi:hypothetical protein BRADI_1g48006v3 [Brachypodium distachyon]|uniref:Uncharacterized protein n=1 Tax=Brachypodium distachyon TaxID=15368 RepID=A0A2K2DQ74_BRADI|nr:hypothetical protein BRADI_1g48006v3 [Brachypodium distachyon]